MPECRIGFATADARPRLARFFARPRRKGMLPREICRWLADAEASKRPLVAAAGDSRLIVRRVAINARDAIALTLELVPKAVPVRLRRHDRLTKRENEVLHWLAQGKTNAVLGSILDIKESTVGKHIEHIYQKIGVETRAGAAGAYEQLKRSQQALAKDGGS